MGASLIAEGWDDGGDLGGEDGSKDRSSSAVLSAPPVDDGSYTCSVQCGIQ